MKVTAIIGSQRKGNTLKTVKKAEELLKDRFSDLEFEYVMLMDADIKMCIGCFNCLAKGIDFCPLKDDIPSIIEKIKASDGVIFASPVYVMNITPFMKNFIDRLSSLCHRPELFNQHSLAVSTTGGIGLKDILKYLNGVAGVWGMRSCTGLGIMTPPVKDFPEKLKLRNERKIKKAVDRFAVNLSKKGHVVPSLSSVLQFHAQRAIFGNIENKDDFPADYDYFSKLKDKKYFVPAEVSFFKNIAGKLTGVIVPKIM